MLKLQDASLVIDGNFINGKTTQGVSIFDVKNPATGETVAQIANSDLAICREAIDVAHQAQKEWKNIPAKQRSNILRTLFRLMMENQKDLAAIITAEMGKPIAEAIGEVAYAAAYVEWFAEEAKRMYGDTVPGPSPDKRVVIIRQPVGVVAAITPWNFPLAMLTRKMAPALAAGCSVVAKPSELTPLSANALAVLADKAGVPAGVFNVIHTTDSDTIGRELCENPKVAKLTFTGSTRVGKLLMERCGRSVKKISFELGGNAPFIVFDDADIDKAVEGAIVSKFRNAGQTCVCANRIYAQSGIHDEFLEKLSTRVKLLKVGNGFDDGVEIGPLINDAAREKVERHLSDALALGAKVETGGNVHELGGNFYDPTVLSGLNGKMKIASEETFGPLAPVFRFDSEEEVIQLANATEYGLASYFYSRDIGRCFRVAEALEVGMVGINTGIMSNEAAPFGGVKQSGLGREGSKYGLDDYTEIKYMCFGEIC